MSKKRSRSKKGRSELQEFLEDKDYKESSDEDSDSDSENSKVSRSSQASDSEVSGSDSETSDGEKQSRRKPSPKQKRRKLTDEEKTKSRSAATKDFKCPFCPKTYSCSQNLRGHTRSHNPEGKIPCLFPGCKEAFDTGMELRRHTLERKHPSIKTEGLPLTFGDVCRAALAASSLKEDTSTSITPPKNETPTKQKTSKSPEAKERKMPSVTCRGCGRVFNANWNCTRHERACQKVSEEIKKTLPPPGKRKRGERKPGNSQTKRAKKEDEKSTKDSRKSSPEGLEESSSVPLMPILPISGFPIPLDVSFMQTQNLLASGGAPELGSTAHKPLEVKSEEDSSKAQKEKTGDGSTEGGETNTHKKKEEDKKDSLDSCPVSVPSLEQATTVKTGKVVSMETDDKPKQEFLEPQVPGVTNSVEKGKEELKIAVPGTGIGSSDGDKKLLKTPSVPSATQTAPAQAFAFPQFLPQTFFNPQAAYPGQQFSPAFPGPFFFPIQLHGQQFQFFSGQTSGGCPQFQPLFVPQFQPMIHQFQQPPQQLQPFVFKGDSVHGSQNSSTGR